MNINIRTLVRKNILELKPYSSARQEFNGKAAVYLDANENPFGSTLPEDFNRYPDPMQWQLKFRLAAIKGVPAENIFVGNGSDEVIDLAYRIFCEPRRDNVIICPPTYGMYEVSAHINDVMVKKVSLLPDFQLDVPGILKAADEFTRLLFICSPNNPTGNNMKQENIEQLLQLFPGIIIIDEAYINYSDQPSCTSELLKHSNLLIMQTLSKAWGLAALRLGLCYGSMDIVMLFNKVKPPYNINLASQNLAWEALSQPSQVNEWTSRVVKERESLAQSLKDFSFIKKIYKSDANFLLIQTNDAEKLYKFLLQNGIIVRNRSNELLCENCIRITVGTATENQQLLKTLQQYE